MLVASLYGGIQSLSDMLALVAVGLSACCGLYIGWFFLLSKCCRRPSIDDRRCGHCTLAHTSPSLLPVLRFGFGCVLVALAFPACNVVAGMATLSAGVVYCTIPSRATMLELAAQYVTDDAGALLHHTEGDKKSGSH